MITATLRGRMCNQMFQIATVIAHAYRMGTGYMLPQRSGKRNQFPMMFPHLRLDEQEPYNQIVYIEPTFGIYQSLPLEDNLHLKGYFQSELYFKEYREQIIQFFDIPSFKTKNKVVSLHIRRGDYIKLEDKHPQPTNKYLNEAFEYFSNYQIEIFSDDILWCKNKFRGDRFIFNETIDPKIALGQMASCENNIIVNSTFSWWGAWLNLNQNKKVICPSSDNWFGGEWKFRLSAQDIPCKDWIQIKYF